MNKIVEQGASQKQLEETRLLIKDFLQSLRTAPDEYDLDFTSETVQVTSFKKLEKFIPTGIDADLVLAGTSDGKLYLIGVFRDEDADFYQVELRFEGSDKFSDATETSG